MSHWQKKIIFASGPLLEFTFRLRILGIQLTLSLSWNLEFETLNFKLPFNLLLLSCVLI